MKNRTSLITVVLVCAVAGGALDFLMNGVLKVVWITITGPTYVVAASTLATALSRSRWASFMSRAVAAFLCGVLLGHLLFQQRKETRVYSMSRVQANVANYGGIALRSEDFSDTLYVKSEKLQQGLVQSSPQQEVPISVVIVKDYGCIQSFKVQTVAGVDVMSDPDATWTWKTDPSAKAFTGVDPHSEDQSLIWCRFHPF